MFPHEVITMGSAGIDFNLAFAAFLHWLHVMFGLNVGV